MQDFDFAQILSNLPKPNTFAQILNFHSILPKFNQFCP